MEEGVLLGTKPLVDSIRHFIRDPSGVARWKTRGRGPGVRGTGYGVPGCGKHGVWKTRGVENTGSGWKTRDLVENTGSEWKTRVLMKKHGETIFFAKI